MKHISTIKPTASICRWQTYLRMQPTKCWKLLDAIGVYLKIEPTCCSDLLVVDRKTLLDEVSNQLSVENYLFEPTCCLNLLVF